MTAKLIAKVLLLTWIFSSVFNSHQADAVSLHRNVVAYQDSHYVMSGQTTGDTIGVLFISGGFDDDYTLDWLIGYFDHVWPFFPPGFLAGGPFEGGTCYTLIHYANEVEAFICGVPEGTPIDAFCNEYTNGATYPIHSLLDHGPSGDNTFSSDCYPDILTTVVLAYGHSTIDPVTLEVIDGPHVDDPDGAGIGVADFLEMTGFVFMEWHHRMLNYKNPHRKHALKWWYGNDAKDYPPDSPELINLKDRLEESMPEHNFVYRHGWESYMENKDPYGQDSFIPDSTETAIDELIRDEGVDQIIVVPLTGAGDSNLAHYGISWYDEDDQGVSRIPGKTYKECVEDITDGLGPKTQEDLDEYLTHKPWDKHQALYPEIVHLVEEIDPAMDLTFVRNYGEFEDFEWSVLNHLHYVVDKLSIPQSASLKVVLGHHGFSAGYMGAAECDAYFPITDDLTSRVKARILDNFSWTSTFEVVGTGFEFAETEYDPPSPDKPFGDVWSVGELIDIAINGKYVNALGQLVDNGEDNFDYVIVIPFIFDTETSDTTYGSREEIFGNNVLTSVQGKPAYARDTTDEDGTDYDADDIDAEHFTVKVFDATGWPSVPGCLDDPDCEQHNQIVYKGSTTNPTTVILSGTILAIDTSNQYALSAREYFTNAVVKAIMEKIEEPLCPIVSLAGTHQMQTDVVRSFRDKVLRNSKEGREYIKLFYSHSPELTSIIMEHPTIKAQARAVLASIIPLMHSSINDNIMAAMDRDMIDDVEDLCNAISVKARPRLKRTIQKLVEDLKEEKIFQIITRDK